MRQKKTKKREMFGTSSLETLRCRLSYPHKFAIIKCHDLPEQMWQMSDPLNGRYANCKTSRYLTTTSSTKRSDNVLLIPPESPGGARPDMNISEAQEGWGEAVSQHPLPGHILWCFRVLWAVCFIEYSYCWCSGWLAIIMPGGRVSWP